MSAAPASLLLLLLNMPAGILNVFCGVPIGPSGHVRKALW